MIKYGYFFVFGAVWWGSFLLSYEIADRYDPEFVRERAECHFDKMMGKCLIMAMIFLIAGKQIHYGQNLILFGIAAGCFSGCISFACFTDRRMCEVYDFCWMLSITAILLIFLRLPPELSEIVELFLFFLLQRCVFIRLFGKADGYAFCVCAFFECVLNMGIMDYWKHMIIAYSLLIVHQAVKRNIAKNGKLYEKVPFLPYITIAFFVNILHLPEQF